MEAAQQGDVPGPAAGVAASGDVAWQSPPEPAVPPEPEDDLEWPGEYSAAPNISVREVEVRVLRALRTERSLRGGRGDGRPGRYRDSVLITIMRGIGRLEYEHIDETRIAPTVAPWQPTRRDIGDELPPSPSEARELAGRKARQVSNRRRDARVRYGGRKPPEPPKPPCIPTRTRRAGRATTEGDA